MSAAPIFSIVIPTFNSEKTLGVALKSFISQSFTNFEILIVDGSSKDNTLLVAMEFPDSRIKIFSELDKGIYDAMNKGIRLSRGSWLYFFGSDDSLFDKDVLRKMFVCINEIDVDIIYGDVHRASLNELYDGEFDSVKILKQNICHQAVFFKKTIFQKTGYFDLYYKVYADWNHNLKWFFDDTIKKRYVKIVVAEYGNDGISSRVIDKSFIFLRHWKYLNATKKNYTFYSKIIMFYKECRKLYKRRRRRDLVRVILELPDFIF